MFSKISVGFTLQYFQMNQRNETHEENEMVWCLSVNPINPQGFSECKKKGDLQRYFCLIFGEEIYHPKQNFLASFTRFQTCVTCFQEMHFSI